VRQLLRAWPLILLGAVSRAAATLPIGLAISAVVAEGTRGRPTGDAALFEQGGQVLAEVLRRNRPDPKVMIAAALATLALAVLPDGALLARVTGAAQTTRAALVLAVRRGGTSALFHVAALIGRGLGVVLVVTLTRWFSAPWFPLALGLLLVVVVEGWAWGARALALGEGQRIGAAARGALAPRALATTAPGLVLAWSLELGVVLAAATVTVRWLPSSLAASFALAGLLVLGVAVRGGLLRWVAWRFLGR
jgi:hypothetical protein